MPCTVDSPDSCEELKFMRILGVDSAEICSSITRPAAGTRCVYDVSLQRWMAAHAVQLLAAYSSITE
eukprot:8835-Heterococcus_DN1.PRE.4